MTFGTNTRTGMARKRRRRTDVASGSNGERENDMRRSIAACGRNASHAMLPMVRRIRRMDNRRVALSSPRSPAGLYHPAAIGDAVTGKAGTAWRCLTKLSIFG